IEQNELYDSFIERDGSSTDASITTGDPEWRHHELPQLRSACPEGAGAGKQVVAPHASEAFAVTLREVRPGGLEARMPGQQGVVVVGAEVVNIFDDEEIFGCVRDLSQRR
ncbi:hypothetical protein RZS08_48320, partial [Arthrospira platensis SPKY1]|nr:hypothetical protein [Arthrospira platensis SPKY1]